MCERCLMLKTHWGTNTNKTGEEISKLILESTLAWLRKKNNERGPGLQQLEECFTILGSLHLVKTILGLLCSKILARLHDTERFKLYVLIPSPSHWVMGKNYHTYTPSTPRPNSVFGLCKRSDIQSSEKHVGNLKAPVV